MSKFFINVMLAGASVITTAGLVAYSDPAVAATVTVHYGPAELASAEGRTEIAKRLRAAASNVCFTTDASERAVAQECKRDAYAQAQKALGKVVASADRPVQVASR